MYLDQPFFSSPGGETDRVEDGQSDEVITTKLFSYRHKCAQSQLLCLSLAPHVVY